MKFISLFAGVGGFDEGMERAGHVPVAQVEWDKNAAGVLKRRWPDVPLFCDVNEVKAEDLPWDEDNLMICGGSPCQAFSVAGLRKSLSDDRGNLALTFNRLCDAIDDLRLNAGKEPAIIVWENVPGVLNTEDNAFGCFLGGLAGSDAPLVPIGEQRWTNSGLVDGPRRSVSWRILDSQFYGVAQRRRRVFALAIGGSRRWSSPNALLPLTNRLPRNPKKGGKTGEDSPSNASGGFTPGSFGGYEEGVGTLRSQGGDLGGGSETLAGACDVYNGEETGETAATVTSATGIANASGPKVMAYSQRGREGGEQIEVDESGVMPALRGGSTHRLGVAHEPAVCSWNGDTTPKASEDVSVTLRSQQGGEGVGVAFGLDQEHNGDVELYGTLKAKENSGGFEGSVAQNLTVRRLTPRECMRLQGFDDDHCDERCELELVGNEWKATGKVVKQADGPIYKQAGNAVSVPVAEFIGKRLASLESS